MSYIKPGIPIYQHREGENRIRFLAWKDGVHFIKPLFLHVNVPCPAKNWREPCSTCEDIKKKLNEGAEWDDVKDVAPAKHPRLLAQIVDRKDEAAGVQVWDVLAYETERAIMELSINENTGAVIPWTNPDQGCDLIYDFDSSEEYPRPRNLCRSEPNRIGVEFYRQVKDFDREIIQRPAYGD